MRKPNPHTSPKIRKMAERILQNPASSTAAKSVAAAALTQAPNKPSKKAIKIVADKAKEILAKHDFAEGNSDKILESV